MSKKILILSADIGGGHDSMAYNIQKQLSAAGYEAIVFNGLSAISRRLHQTIRDGHAFQLQHLPGKYYAGAYEFINGPLSNVVSWNFWLRYRKRMLNLISGYGPDLIISTYPLLTSICARLRRDGDISIPLVACLIDANPHELWLPKGVDLFLTPNPSDLQIIPDAVLIRPPIEMKEIPLSQSELKERFEFDPNERLLLWNGGAWGVGDVTDIGNVIEAATEADWQVAILCGKNTELQEITSSLDIDGVQALGWRDDVPELIKASDAVILGSGGMSYHETIQANRVAIFFRPMAGHGQASAKALNDAGYVAYPQDKEELKGLLMMGNTKLLKMINQYQRDITQAQRLITVIQGILK